MLDKQTRLLLAAHIKRYVKWFDEAYGNTIPENEVIDYAYGYLDGKVKPFVTRERFRHLFKLRLSHYQLSKG